MKYQGSDYSIVFKSPRPETIYAYSPSVIAHNDNIIVSMDLGGKDISSLEGSMKNGREYRGRIYLSEDKGKSFNFIDTFCFKHARLFSDDNNLYIIGHNKDLMIIRSSDGGYSWSEEYVLTSGERYHAAPTNVIEHNGYIYMAFEKYIQNDVKGWPVSALAPILLRAKKGTDLTKRENWSFSEAPAFREAIDQKELNFFGVPFYDTPKKESAFFDGRECAPMGWLETNVVKIYDKHHYWYGDNTFHLFMRAHTGGTNYCTMMKVTEEEDGAMITAHETVPSGRKITFLPMPGGQMKFHIVYDDTTQLYWLLSSQATDSCTKCEYLPSDRYNLPNNERNRLQLSFSKNMVDWCFACIVDIGDTQKQSRHYAAMTIDGEDIIIASRSGDEDSFCAHNCNLITFHRIKKFRDLVY